MAQVEIKIPTVGESITEATMGKWNYKDGDWVEKDAVVFEIETEKATMEVNSPASGKLAIQSNSGDVVGIGATVGSIDTAATKTAGAPSTKPTEAPKPNFVPPMPAKPASTASVPKMPSPSPVMMSPGGHVSPQPTPNSTASSTVNSTPPLTPASTRGLGPAKRKAIREGRATILPTITPSPASVEPAADGSRRVPMSVIRKKIAERLMYSQSSTATLTTFNEVDMSNVMNIRNQAKDEFQTRFGVKLGFMSFFGRAVCYGVTQVPVLNAFLEGHEIVYNDNVHLGVAVSTDRGLVVPVVRRANLKSFADLEKDIAALAEKARAGKLGIDDMTGGTFSLTNGGVFGSLLSTPILNPPQSAILGMHKTENRPMAIERDGAWSVEVRPMMYLAMSYDHRLIDGRDSVTFLVKVKEYLETVKVDDVMKG